MISSSSVVYLRCCQYCQQSNINGFRTPQSALPVLKCLCQNVLSSRPTRICSTRRQSRRAIFVMARSPRYDDESVEFDEENSWSSQARRNAGLVPSMAGTFLLAANSLGNKLTDIAFDLAPSNVERGTVEIAVKAALILLAVSVAKSLLGVALTLGTVVFGIYVATKVWSKPAADDAAGKPGRMQPGKQRQSRRQDDDGLSDVWFESKSKRKNTRKSQEDSSW
ncbi:TPA: hypothetical protein ACH3X1_000865 [Trebouxia sp. C0004]